MQVGPRPMAREDRRDLARTIVARAQPVHGDGHLRVLSRQTPGRSRVPPRDAKAIITRERSTK